MDGHPLSDHRMAEEMEEKIVSPPGNDASHRSAGGSQDEALDQVLPDQSPAAAAHRGAHGKLVPAGIDLRHHQSSDIDAAQQQNGNDEALHQVKRIGVRSSKERRE